MGNRTRKARGRKAPEATALNKGHALARLTHLKGRSVDVDFVPSGIEVVAATPEELSHETDREIVRRTGQTEN